MATSEPYSVDKLTAEARRLAADYRRATGKTLPLSGEIAVNDAVRLLNLRVPDEPQGGCDALRDVAGQVRRVQIKARVMFNEGAATPRIGQLRLDQDWDETVLVLMNDDYETSEIFRADRATIEAAVAEKSPNKRGAMTVAQFRIIGRRVWSADEGLLADSE